MMLRSIFGAWGAGRLLTLALLASSLGLLNAAHGDVDGGNSRSFGISVNLTLVGVPVLGVPEQPVSSGTAPGPYSDADQVLSLFVGDPIVGSVGTSVMDTTAESDIDGGSGSRFAASDSLVDNLAIELVPSAVVPSLLLLTADTIGSDSTTSGDYGSLSAVGQMVLENLTIAVSGSSLNIPINPDPNTVIWDSSGLRIVLNEQVSSVFLGSASMDTNAIHIQLDDVLTTGGLLSGDIIVAHSDAGMTAVVPEPTTMVVLGGLTLLALRKIRRA